MAQGVHRPMAHRTPANRGLPPAQQHTTPVRAKIAPHCPDGPPYQISGLIIRRVIKLVSARRAPEVLILITEMGGGMAREVSDGLFVQVPGVAREMGG